MKAFYVRKEWSASDYETVIVIASTADEIRDYYAAMGDRGPRYVSVYEAAGYYELKAGKMKALESK